MWFEATQVHHLTQSHEENSPLWVSSLLLHLQHCIPIFSFQHISFLLTVSKATGVIVRMGERFFWCAFSREKTNWRPMESGLLGIKVWMRSYLRTLAILSFSLLLYLVQIFFFHNIFQEGLIIKSCLSFQSLSFYALRSGIIQVR